MKPSYNDGNMIFIFKLFRNIEENSTIIIKVDDEYFLKRVVARKNDVVKEHDNKLYINDCEIKNYVTKSEIVYTLKEDEYYVLGDNYLCSVDSRVIGLITKDKIIGLVINNRRVEYDNTD